MAGTKRPWLELLSQSIASCSSALAWEREASALSRSATRSAGSGEKLESRIWTSAKSGSACAALRHSWNPSRKCRVWQRASPAANNARASGDEVVTVMPGSFADTGTCVAANAEMESPETDNAKQQKTT